MSHRSYRSPPPHRESGYDERDRDSRNRPSKGDYRDGPFSRDTSRLNRDTDRVQMGPTATPIAEHFPRRRDYFEEPLLPRRHGHETDRPRNTTDRPRNVQYELRNDASNERGRSSIKKIPSGGGGPKRMSSLERFEMTQMVSAGVAKPINYIADITNHQKKYSLLGGDSDNDEDFHDNRIQEDLMFGDEEQLDGVERTFDVEIIKEVPYLQ